MKERIFALVFAVCLVGVPFAVSGTDDTNADTAVSDFEELEYVVYDILRVNRQPLF